MNVAFHIGRGGHFRNGGHKTYNPDITCIQDCFSKCFIHNTDDNDNELPDDEWLLIDGGGNVILKGREAIESETGVLEWDTIYDTDIVKNVEDCTEEEIDILYEAYIDGKLTDDEVIDYILA